MFVANVDVEIQKKRGGDAVYDLGNTPFKYEHFFTNIRRLIYNNIVHIRLSCQNTYWQTRIKKNV